jgi:hypothetical protein
MTSTLMHQRTTRTGATYLRPRSGGRADGSRLPAARVRRRGHGRAARRDRVRRWFTDRVGAARATVGARRDDGMATAEYAIATIAAVGFAGLLVAVLKSATVKSLLSGLISTALSIG